MPFQLLRFGVKHALHVDSCSQYEHTTLNSNGALYVCAVKTRQHVMSTFRMTLLCLYVLLLTFAKQSALAVRLHVSVKAGSHVALEPASKK